jgi:hypothetical protein
METISTMELLADYAELLNGFGVDSEEADNFLEVNKGNTEFVQLATLSRDLKKALTTPTSDAIRSRGCRA